MNSVLVLATLNLALGGLVFLLGMLILRENPRQRLNQVVSLMLFFGGFGALLTALGLLPGRGVVGVVFKPVGDALVEQGITWSCHALRSSDFTRARSSVSRATRRCRTA